SASRERSECKPDRAQPSSGERSECKPDRARPPSNDAGAKIAPARSNAVETRKREPDCRTPCGHQPCGGCSDYESPRTRSRRTHPHVLGRRTPGSSGRHRSILAKSNCVPDGGIVRMAGGVVARPRVQTAPIEPDYAAARFAVGAVVAISLRNAPVTPISDPNNTPPNIAHELRTRPSKKVM